MKYKMTLPDSVLAFRLLDNAILKSSTMALNPNFICDYKSAVEEYQISLEKDIWWNCIWWWGSSSGV